MPSFDTQQTIVKPTTIQGFGYFSGHDVTVTFLPAKENSGLVFVRSDLNDAEIPALVAFRQEAERRTVLAKNGASVEMVEHILAALSGLNIDNCRIDVDQPEMPGCDGSALHFVEALLKAGIQPQEAPRKSIRVLNTMRVGNDESWIELSPSDNDSLSIEYQLDYGCGPIGQQTFSLQLNEERFRNELASARTFLLQEEAEAMRDQGVGKRVTTNDLLIFDSTGPRKNKLRFENECVRHKMLDVIGDFALAGRSIIGKVIARKSGHRLNAAIVSELLKSIETSVDTELKIPA